MVEVSVATLARVFHRRASHPFGPFGPSCHVCEKLAATLLADVAAELGLPSTEYSAAAAAAGAPLAAIPPLTGVALEEVLVRIGTRPNTDAPRCFP